MSTFKCDTNSAIVVRIITTHQYHPNVKVAKNQCMHCAEKDIQWKSVLAAVCTANGLFAQHDVMEGT